MSWKLPPLPTLKAFESTVRCGTMVEAGDELCISQVAISKQVAKLERALHTTLFLRGGKRLQLTPDGDKLYLVVSRIFHELQTVSEDISGQDQLRGLNICGYSNFTMRWLVPRLWHFRKKHPLVDICLTSSLEDLDFERSNYDGAIRSGDGKWPKCHAVELVPIELIPVCHPNLVKELQEIGVQGLSEKTLLHSVARPNDWHLWLTASKTRDVDPFSGIKFDNGSMAYQASAEGLGVSIAQKVLIMDDVLCGRLAIPFDLSVSSGESYWFVWPETRGSSKISVFRNWLQEDAKNVRGAEC